MDLLRFADWITNPSNLFAVIAAILVFATVWTLSAPALNKDNTSKRLKAGRQPPRRAAPQGARGDGEG
jgi:predicted small integral membrane protein